MLDVDSVGRREETPRLIMVRFDVSDTPEVEVAGLDVSGLSELVAGEDANGGLRACR